MFIKFTDHFKVLLEVSLPLQHSGSMRRPVTLDGKLILTYFEPSPVT